MLTPGPFNSAYFEHSFLARQLGIELVQSADLYVDSDQVWLRTTLGPRRVHVIYRRTDEAFLDPEMFREDRFADRRARPDARVREGERHARVNAPGNGVADDKAVYAFVPEMIRYYLGGRAAAGAGADLALHAQSDDRSLRPRAPATSWSSRRSTRQAGTEC